MKLQVSSRNDDFLPAVLYRVTAFDNELRWRCKCAAAMMTVSQRWQCREVRRRVGVGVEVEEVKIGDGTSA
jgi:hypothetical protein